jgi:hypothetical protein
MTKRIAFRGFDPIKAHKLTGYKITWTDRLILMRSKLTHLEIQFLDRPNSPSFSSTMADGANGCRFKYISYSNPEQWDTEILEVSDWEEAEMWSDACRMADVSVNWQYLPWQSATYHGIVQENKDVFYATLKDITVYQGKNHIPYDTHGLASFCLERTGKWYLDALRGLIWGWTNCFQPDESKAWCSEACSIIWNAGIVSKVRLILPTEIDPQAAMEKIRKIKKG